MSKPITTEEEYRRRLDAHDWFGNYADEQKVWMAWREERIALEDAARILDRNFTIWNQYAPEQFKK